jgi:hypothetical protein
MMPISATALRQKARERFVEARKALTPEANLRLFGEMLELWNAADELERQASRTAVAASGPVPEPLRERFAEWELALSAPATASQGIEAVTRSLLASVMRLQSADYGSVQLFSEPERTLELVAQRGLGRDFLAFVRRVSVDERSDGIRALRNRTPIFVEEVETDADFAPFRAMAANAGFRAMLSTPMVASDGAFVGVLSTHFLRPGIAGSRCPALMMDHVRRAADVIAGLRADPRAAGRTGAVL